jgi:diguanylate cyclase (GGDEF)-like protein/PAS domain S-box-containing protein
VQNNKKQNFKRYFENIDFLTIFFLLLMGFIIVLFVYIQNIYKTEKKYNFFHDIVYKLEALDAKFDSFMLQRTKLINLDKITQDSKEFGDLTTGLINGNLSKDFDKSIKINLIQLKKLFLRKRVLLERFKSYNATSIYNIAYLIDLSKNIQKDNAFTNGDKLILDASLADIFKLYLNFQINDVFLKLNISKLNKIQNKTNELVSFVINAKSTQKELQQINLLKDNALKIPLLNQILKIHKKLDISYGKLKNRQDTIYTSMFIFALLILGFLIYVYTKSIKQRKELVSFKYAVQNSDDTIVITDAQRNITYINKAFTKSTGYSQEEAIGQNPRILKSGKLPQEFYDDMNTLLNQGKKWAGEFINKDKFGNFYYEKASISPMFINNELNGYLAIKLNITDYIKEQEKTKFLAYNDSLTALPNRRELKKILKKNFEKEEDFYLLFLDLDGFKSINDTLGHDVGDLLLREISKRLKAYATKENNIFRTGGDEFAIILKNSSLTTIIDITQNILKTINEPIHLESHILKVGVSIGIAKRDKKSTIVTILKHADIAMYEAKNKGKNSYKFFNKKLALVVQKNIGIEQQLLDAFENDEFYVVYQPKYDLLSKKVLSLEILVRWENKKLGLVSPDVFIPIAENSKIIHDIGLFVFEKACKDFKEIQKHCPNIRNISVNVSLSQIQDIDLSKKFTSILHQYDLFARNMGLELTETHVMKNIVENIDSINHLRSLGFKIIIDDFGTGYSSMAYLKKLPITNLKIDKSFVDDISIDKNDLAIAKTILDLSKNFGYITTAEGIETKEQEEILRNLGVNMGQGYLFSKPLKKEDLLKFLDSKSG